MFASLLLTACALVGQAEADTSAQLKANVQRLVRQLDDSSPMRRVAAEKSLIELGPDALPLLPKITPRTSAEVKDRLGRVRTELEKALAESATKATRVTLQGEMTLQEALAAMEKQTGNKAMVTQGGDAAVTADFKDTPYWEALDDLLDQANLTVDIYGGQFNSLTIGARPDGQSQRYAAGDYSGLFRFEPVRVEAMRNLRNPEVNGMQLTMEVAWEPRMTPISLEQSAADLEIKDGQGNDLQIEPRRGQMEAAGSADIPAVEIVVPMSLPPRDVRKISSLKGKIVAMLPGRKEKFEFSKIENANRVEQRRAGVTVTLEQVRQNNALWVVYAEVSFDRAANALESHRGWIYQNDAYLLDPQGNRVDYATLETTQQSENSVGLAYLFDLPKGPAGHKFVYETPAAIIRMPVEYELKDIPLP